MFDNQLCYAHNSVYFFFLSIVQAKGIKRNIKINGNESINLFLAFLFNFVKSNQFLIQFSAANIIGLFQKWLENRIHDRIKINCMYFWVEKFHLRVPATQHDVHFFTKIRVL